MPDHDHRSPWARHDLGVDPYAVPREAAGYATEPVPATAPLQPYGAPSPFPAAPIEVRVVGGATPGRGLAIAGVVLGGLALLGVLLLGVFALVVTFAGDEGGGGYYGPMRGTVAPVKGSPLTGSALAEEVTRKVRDDGGLPEGVSCPATLKVAQDVTTVCHGTDDGEDSSFVVFFEDAQGDYTLLEI